MTSHYRHRRIFNPATAFPTPLEPGEIAVNSANRQLALGDADPASPGATKLLLAVRYFDVKAQYAANEFVVQAGGLYRSKAAVTPGAFNATQWDLYNTDPATKTYVDAGDAAITTAFQNADAAIITNYQAADTTLTNSVNAKVAKGGDTMTGALLLSGTPIDDQQAATKKYVDDTVAAGGKTPTAAQIANVPSGTIASANVQLALNELDLEKAPLASPQFNGNPRAPTPLPNDNSISIATTAFVAGQASTLAPLAAGLALPGSSLKYAREDHVHPPDTTRAPIDSPAFSGNPTAPTPPPGDNDQTIATTAFVQSTMVGVSGFSTADAKLTLKTVADAGWVMMNDGTIGNPTSGATARASSDTQPLFIVLWNNIPDVYCPVLPGGRGANAAADFAAGKTLKLPLELGRAIAIAGSGASLSGRALGQFIGEEGHTLIAGEQASMPVSTNVSASGSLTSGSVRFKDNDDFAGGVQRPQTPPMLHDVGPPPGGGGITDVPVTGTVTVTGSGTGTATGGGQAHNNMQPTSFWNVMIKL
jgi:microcystin-dependent protein